MSFTFAMITLPIGTYFFSVSFVFQGKLIPDFNSLSDYDADVSRQPNMGRGSGSTHGKRSLDCVCGHGVQG
jgi:hypothetical protein